MLPGRRRAGRGRWDLWMGAWTRYCSLKPARSGKDWMDERRPESIPEESKRLQKEWQASSQPDAPLEPVRDGAPMPTQSYWTPPEPEPPATGRRIGWLLVVIAAGAIIGFGAYLGLPESTDPDDGGWAEVAFFISPFFALIAALALSAVIWVVGLLRLADISVYRARDAAVGGGCLAPIAYFVILAVGASTFDSMLYAGRGYIAIFTLPILMGVIFALGAAMARRRSG